MDWLFQIPGIYHFLHALRDEKNFNNFLCIHLLNSAVLIFLPLHNWFPFGQLYFNMRRALHTEDPGAPEAEQKQETHMKSKSKLAEKAKSKQQVRKVKGMSKLRFKTFPAKLGVFLSHVPCPLVFTYVQFFYPSGDILSIPSLAFLAMTCYRAFIYPFFRNKYATEIPRVTVGFYSAISFHIGLCASRILAVVPNVNLHDSRYIIQQYVILALFAMSFIYLIMHDWHICRSRTERSYDISMYATNKWGWERVTCPQYCWTFVTYLIWIFLLPDRVQALSFMVYIYVLTAGRADIVHGILCQSIPGYAFSGRKPCFFFLNHSKAFLRLY
ncbi:hypothetical protein TVAG_325970 [Trichomonas vaginalis G3]|uniref:Polyprenol reductase n=1 Tax=Trichomonas vaginalis (strain ATCC PRA-98 / G3) TaxID=412133 RepID=A2G8Q4_TRIV3|nr:3-oxo-5-alpha-steroid 4-dehydrogenase family [Trichomonas vaginalis G3]EAX86462.1 hypothetical protein TVAG_325970 [Trichomonas vaginalis G3]KAI5511898.1 3-oxo-5-alpha-steroid 4-dehydrogenase family [Trichomonas vaginalis G3]|eukprot:XP_001299392.1 hypothetical protein [Trichomonas vaginalis G3]